MDGERESDQERITNLESALAHHQREFELLNQVVVAQAAAIEKLERKLHSIESNMQTVESRLSDERDPMDEKPPHY